ncbi:hypothetical protein [Euzebyella saccharophila]|uniref:Uncharacterized protein n=1 Tax=Euzebyella saccharophila TaxID=679664 RepID=A0ABV8JUL6_9FLAO|nr:hypothetical protein [Euzebyella saccharophila]
MNVFFGWWWERASSFGFSALEISVGKNQMCLTVWWFFQLAGNIGSCMISCGLLQRKMSASTEDS